ncbi:hypothetical protein [Skermania piniformis]|uniref:WXG100 family type VII secretion target n=1 Tax=Skermania pinensis TaxID=39122 RepID=A0ABX8SB83_9ACTN|nr:hypothetical protein [Skermania piniformis]QXQ14442.1 hypothetical protein KV203_03220 [Skermania piniformis]
MGSVQANPDSLKKLKSDIDRSQREINGAISRVRSSLKGTDWRDSVKDKFEKDMEQVLKSVAAFDANANQLKAYLDKKIQILQTYQGR